MDTPHHVVCPDCQSVNRFTGNRPDPICGSCKAPLYPDHPPQLTDATFDTHVNRTTLPLVVDFWAPWCGPCQAMAPSFEKAAVEMRPLVRFAKVNSDENPKVSVRHMIRSIPTVILFRDGKEVARKSGAMDQRALTAWVQTNVA